MAVRRVEVAETHFSTLELPRPDYASTFEMPRPAGDARSAERWMRDVWEQAPSALRPVLTTGWRFGLGLRLGPRRSPGHVLRWEISSTAPDQTVVTARSRFLAASNDLEVTETHVRWTTVVQFDRRVGRLMWSMAVPVHHLLIPFLMRRAAARKPSDHVTP